MLWQHDTSTDGPSAQFHGDALLTEELVIVGSDARPTARLYAFERAGGAVRWQHEFPFGVAVDLVREGNAVLTTSMNFELAAFDIASGEPLWWSETGLDGSPGSPPVDPALVDGVYYVPWPTGHLDAYVAATGELRWRRELPATANSSAVTVGENLVVGTVDGQLLNIGRADGAVLGRLTVGGMVYGELVRAGGCLLALVAPAPSDGGTGHSIACVEDDLSGVRWSFVNQAEGSFGTFEPLVVGDQVIVGARGELHGLELATGSVLWSRSVEGLPRGLASSPEALYVGTLAGKVMALPWVSPSH